MTPRAEVANAFFRALPAWLVLCLCMYGTTADAQYIREDFDVTNGPVDKMQLSGNTLYMCGSFTQVGPVTGCGAPLDITTGAPEVGFPRVVGSILAVAPDGLGGWYIGGVFTAVGNAARSNIAHVLADHSVAPWNPNAVGSVRGLVVRGEVVYACGGFTNIGGQPRNGVAALNATTGLATAWSNPNANATARAIAFAGTALYVVGDFTSIGGQPRSYLAALDTATGLATSWNPNADGSIRTLLINGTTVYVGGNFLNIGGQPRTRIAALSRTTGLATTWKPGANNTVLAFAAKGTVLYAGGFFTTIGGQARNGIAELSTTTGLASGWNPNPNGAVWSLELTGTTVYAGGVFTNIGGAERVSIAALSDTTGLATAFESNAWNNTAGVPGVYALSLTGTKVFAGGDSENLGGKRRNHLAAIDVIAGKVTDWNPNPVGSIYTIAVDATTVFVGGSFGSIGGEACGNLAAVSRVDGLQGNWRFFVLEGQVYSLAVKGTTLFVGGNYHDLESCKHQPQSCTSYVAFGSGRPEITAADTASSSDGFDPFDVPSAPGEVTFLKVSGNTVYASGGFDFIGGQFRTRAAALNAFNAGASGWTPNPDGDIVELVASGGLQYVVGRFYNIGNQIRVGVGALDALTGAATTWDALSNGFVSGLAMNATGVLVGGAFTNIGGQPRNYIAALDPVTALALPWNPDANGNVSALVQYGNTVIAGGGFTTMRGLPRAHLAVIGTGTLGVPGGQAEHELALLQQNTPNPFTRSTSIRFTLSRPERVTLSVFDIAGREVRTLLRDDRREAGSHQVEFQPIGLPNGVYLYRLTLGDHVLAKKMLYLR